MKALNGWRFGASALLVGAAIASSAEARFGGMAIHPGFGGGGFHGGGNIGGGGGFHGGGASSLSRPGQGGSGTQFERPDHGGMVGWDNASRGPPRPDPNPGPGPGPGPHPHPDPYPVPVPVPYPAWGPYWGWDDGWYDWNDSFAAGAVVGATVGAATAAAVSSAPPPPVGTIVEILPSGCVSVIVNNVSYDQCGSVWYKPQYAGTSIQYLVVAPPR